MRIQPKRQRHLLVIEQRNTLRETEMTKIASFAAAFVLFAPIAVAVLMQAAQIVM